MPASVTASHSRPATTQSAEPQGQWGRLAVCSESDVIPLLPDNTREVNDHSEIKNRQHDQPSQHRKPASTSPQARQLPDAAGATVGGNNDRWIPVPDAATLGKIGHDPEYPLIGHYQQTGDIDGSQLSQPIGNDTHPFNGSLGHKNGTICNLSSCLVHTLGGTGRLNGLEFNGANIRGKGPVAVAACTIADAAMVSNIRVNNAHVVALGDVAGIAGGDVRGTVFNTTAVNCTVVSDGMEYAGAAGIGAGLVRDYGRVVDTTAVNCTSANSEYSGAAGIGAGKLVARRESGRRRDGHGTVVNTRAVNCKVENFAQFGGAGIGVGTAYNDGTIVGTRAVNCSVENSGKFGDAGIGLGKAVFFGMVADTTAVNCTVTASGSSNAGIGVGGGIFSLATVADTIAVNCHVTTSGTVTGAGIGAGMLNTGFDSTKIVDTTALNCTVATSGEGASAGIGAGVLDTLTSVASTTAINCEVDSEYAGAGVKGGPDPDLCDVRVNGHWENNTVPGCHPWLDNLCAGIDPGLLAPDCRPGDYDFAALANNPVSQCVFYPVVPTATPTTSSNNNSRALGLSQAAVAGIALGGGVLFVLVVGLCIYHYCRQRASAVAGYSPILAGGTGDDNPGTRSPERSVNPLPNLAQDSDEGELVPLLRLV